jgi:hypothetical protein
MKEEALLMVLWEPPAAMEDEFNAWYDTEHLPERACIAGFRTARRYVGLGDGPRHMALYDLSSLGVLKEPAYQAISGANYSPWSNRIMAKIPPQRLAARLHTGPADATTACIRLRVLKFAVASAGDVDRLAAALPPILDGAAGLIRWRLFAGVEPRPDTALVVAECSSTAVFDIDAAATGLAMTMAATYRPYLT